MKYGSYRRNFNGRILMRNPKSEEGPLTCSLFRAISVAEDRIGSLDERHSRLM